MIAVTDARDDIGVDPVVLIRISKLYRHNMSAQSLYEATRGFWKEGPRRTKARYAFAVLEGVTRDVFEIERWHPAGTTAYTTRDSSQTGPGKRWEFTGRLATESVRANCVEKSVSRYMRKGAQNPLAYVNCEK